MSLSATYRICLPGHSLPTRFFIHFSEAKKQNIMLSHPQLTWSYIAKGNVKFFGAPAIAMHANENDRATKFIYWDPWLSLSGRWSYMMQWKSPILTEVSTTKHVRNWSKHGKSITHRLNAQPPQYAQ